MCKRQEHWPIGFQQSNAGLARALGPPSVASSQTWVSSSSQAFNHAPSPVNFDVPITCEEDGEQQVSLELSSDEVNHLKTKAVEIAAELEVPEDKLITFAKLGNIGLMLLHIYVSILQWDKTSTEEAFNKMKSELESKDFEVMLKKRLTSCLLLPNIMAYVVDTHENILALMQEHMEVFKVSSIYFEDLELNTLLGKLVAKVLANCHSQIKTQLTRSLAEHLSIVELVQQLSMYNLFTPIILSLLPLDLHQIVKEETGFSMDVLVEQLSGDQDKPQDDDPSDKHPANNDPYATLDYSLMDGDDASGHVDGGAEDVNELVLPDEMEDDLDSNGELANFGSIKWSSSQFWNYVDHMLEKICMHAKDTRNTPQEQQQIYNNILQDYLQQDLKDFSGNKKIQRFIKNTLGAVPKKSGFQWQEAIDMGLFCFIPKASSGILDICMEAMFGGSCEHYEHKFSCAKYQ
ncbi:hypothetical protein J3A83DRAFT_4184831 [Scleroderma citrinum]